jgi:hypothetical protein
MNSINFNEGLHWRPLQTEIIGAKENMQRQIVACFISKNKYLFNKFIHMQPHNRNLVLNLSQIKFCLLILFFCF